MLVVEAIASSAGKEVHNQDNSFITTIDLLESAEFEIYGKSIKGYINKNSIIEQFQSDVTQAITIVNNGPSQPSSNIDIIVTIPHLLCNKIGICRKIIGNATFETIYQGNVVENIYKNYNPTETSTLEIVQDVIVEQETIPDDLLVKRSKRDINEEITFVSTDIINHLPEHKTIILSCKNNEDEAIECLEFKIRIDSFVVGQDPVKITLNFTINPEILSIMNEAEKDLLIIETTVVVANSDEYKENNTEIKYSTVQSAHFMIFRSFDSSNPLWIFLVAILIGLVLLGITAYLLQKCGFFKRTKKEELEKLTKGVRFFLFLFRFICLKLDYYYCRVNHTFHMIWIFINIKQH